MSTITYMRKTAGGIMKTAEIAKTRAGTVEVFVRLPDGQAIAILTDNDTMTCTRAEGFVCDLVMSKSARDKLSDMSNKADRMMEAA